MNHAVRLENVDQRYGAIHALKALNLELMPGEVLGLLGHNGAGKSTLMKLVLGILAPDAGRITVLGENPRGPGAHTLRMRLGYLPENVSFYDNLSGREVLRFFSRLKHVPVAEADRLLERVGLGEAAARRVGAYSKGMRQRLGLAQALLGRPRLLLLDEPTVGLDPLAVRDVYAMIDALRGEGTSVMLSSHVLPGVEHHVDRVAILCEGRLLAAGTLNELREQAGLPLRIQARGRPLEDDLLRQLAGQAVDVERNDHGDIRLLSPPGAKLGVLRSLLSSPGLEDVSVDSPTLDTLYAHFDVRGRQGSRAHA